MKLLKFLFSAVFLFSLTSCVKFRGTDQWVFAEGLWLILAIPLIGAALLIRYALKIQKSKTLEYHKTHVKETDYKFPIYKIWAFKFAAVLIVAAIVFFLYQNTQA